MKNRMWLSLLAIGVVSMFALSSCSTETTAPADDTAPLFMEVEETSSYELFVESMEITEGTLDAQPELLEGDRPDRRRRRGPGVRNPRGDDGMVHPFGRCLNQLELTDDQVAQIRRALMAHHDCVKGVWEGYRDHMRELLGKAREARMEIMAKVRSGEMTREEAREALRNIHKRIKNALQNSNIRQRVREALRDCDRNFRGALAEILTPEQLAELRDCMTQFDDEDPRENGDRDRDRDDDSDDDDDEDEDEDEDEEEDEDEDEDEDNSTGRRG